MYRSALERASTLHEWRKSVWFKLEKRGPADLANENRRWSQPNRFRKTDFMDCGKARCHVCHPDKLLNKPSRQEILGRQRFEEQLAELSER